MIGKTMQTIGKTARQYKLSRSTLLYYDRTGLLRPVGRSASGYRLYSRKDLARLEKIAFFRRTGLGLKEIARLLESPASELQATLERQLVQLDERMYSLRSQQQLILQILRKDNLPRMRGMDKDRWTELLRAVGLDDAAMRQWHAAFERLTPEGHHDFLAALGLAEAEITSIRQWARCVPEVP
jgi:MerR family transcriptional regulator, thiopeptide resistance regulator